MGCIYANKKTKIKMIRQSEKKSNKKGDLNLSNRFLSRSVEVGFALLGLGVAKSIKIDRFMGVLVFGLAGTFFTETFLPDHKYLVIGKNKKENK